MAYVNTILALAVIFSGLWYAVKGRRFDRGIMVSNVVAGCWVLAVYLIVLYDSMIKDILSNREVTMYLIRPALMVLLATALGNIIRIGRRKEDGK